MAFDATKAERLLSRRQFGRSEMTVLVLAAVALAAGAAAWISDPDQTAPFASAALPSQQDQVSFHERFGAISTNEMSLSDPALQPFNHPSRMTALKTKLWDSKALLARQLMFSDWRSASVDAAATTGDSSPSADEPSSSAAPAVPLPRPRPVMASVEVPEEPAVAQADGGADNRTLLQKLSDLVPGRVTLASLVPEGGLFRRKPDLASLGYDNQTAVYDISARVVYLPNGESLEAHSGMGRLRDDPEHVNQQRLGATPPAVYELKPREKLFHGVQALRMIPADGNSIFGRSGILAHPFMLGPDGDSNGCVSIRDYDRFLKAYSDGVITRLVVVPSLSGVATASQRPTSQS
jgi:hypothetical protein